MLVITRKPKEQIIITLGGEEVIVQVGFIERGKVQLAFKASRQVRIDREEVHLRRLEEKRNGNQ